MWKFTNISRNETRATNKLKDFFPDAGDSESVIRETGQNVLDAKSEDLPGKPALINISLGRKNKGDVDWLFSSFESHVKSVIEQTDHTYPKEIEDEFDYLLIEDFHTTGFTGTFDNEDEEEKGSLISFWWEEGESNKVKGSGGSHGVGKVTLSEASQAGLFFANSIREDDSDEILFGYCRIGRHEHKGKQQREYARFGVDFESQDDEPFPRPYSRAKGEGDVIDKFKDAFGIDRSESGSSLVIPAIDGDLISYVKILDTLLKNFYLPIMKGLLEVRLKDRVGNKEIFLNKSNFSSIVSELKSSDITYMQKLSLAESLLTPEKFFNTAPGYKFSREEATSVSADSFNEERLQEMRAEYASGSPVKVRLNVNLHPADSGPENGIMQLVLQKRNSKAESGDTQFYDAFRGEVLIQDEKLRTGKASAILDIYRYQNEEKANPLSEFMKYCEDPGHKNWAGSINRRHEKLHYKRNEVWQKNFVRSAVRDLIAVLEDEGEKDIQDFADDLFFILEENEREVPGNELDDEGIDGDDDGASIGPRPDIPSSIPLVSITKTEYGILIKNTKKMSEADVGGSGQPSINIQICYEMYGTSKAVWRKTAKTEIDLNHDNYVIKNENVKLLNVDKNTMEVSIKANEFSLSVEGFDLNRQLYVDVKDRELSKYLFGETA